MDEIATLANSVAAVKKELDQLDDAIRSEVIAVLGVRKTITSVKADNDKLSHTIHSIKEEVYSHDCDLEDLTCLIDCLNKQLQDAATQKQQLEASACL